MVSHRFYRIPLLIFFFTMLIATLTLFLTINLDPRVAHESSNWVLFEDFDNNQFTLDISESSNEHYHANYEVGYHWQLRGRVIVYDNFWGFSFQKGTIEFTSWSLELDNYYFTISELSSNIDTYLNHEAGIYVKVVRIFYTQYRFIPSLLVLFNFGCIGGSGLIIWVLYKRKL